VDSSGADNAVHSTSADRAETSQCSSSGVHGKCSKSPPTRCVSKNFAASRSRAYGNGRPRRRNAVRANHIYGMSWVDSETLALARELDTGNSCAANHTSNSVAKPGQNDEVIPANVAEAANFYQTNGLLHGRPQIRAQEQGRTEFWATFATTTRQILCDAKVPLVRSRIHKISHGN